MAITIGSNIASLTAQRRLGEATTKVGGALERLSSGLRINRASDDAAGLAIADSLNANSRIYTQGIRNGNDGLSYLAVAQSTVSDLIALSTRQSELAEQAANGVYSYNQRQAIQKESDALVAEHNRLVASVRFNGSDIFGDGAHTLNLQLGTGTQAVLGLDIGSSMARQVGSGNFNSPTSFVTGVGFANFSEASGDFNKDGYGDVVTGSFGNGAIGFINGSSTGATVGASFSSGFQDVRRIDSGDLNGDGYDDLLISGSNAGGAGLKVFLNNRNGTFTQSQSLLNQDAEGQLLDADGDGDLDIAAMIFGSANVAVWTNSAGSFTVGRTINSGLGSVGYCQIATGDINGDSIDDVIFTSGATINAFLGSASASFSLSSSLQESTSVLKLVLTDINQDGLADIVYSNSSTNNLYTVRGSASGKLSDGPTFSNILAGISAERLVAGDLDGDGINEIVAGQGLIATSVVSLLDGGTRATAKVINAATNNGQGLALADINGDGAIDVATANYVAGRDSEIIFGVAKSTFTSQRFDLSTQKSARASIKLLNAQRERLSSELGKIGAFQSRLTVGINNLFSQRDQFIAAASRIQDADVASESAELTRASIVQQAAASILAQANQQPSLALTLLRS